MSKIILIAAMAASLSFGAMALVPEDRPAHLAPQDQINSQSLEISL